MIEIQLNPEYVLRVGGFLVSNALFTSLITSVVLAATALIMRRSLTNEFGTNKGQRIVEAVCEPLWNLCTGVLGSQELAARIFPVIATFFLFIITANWIEVLPGFLNSFYVQTPEGTLSLFRSPSSDLSTTLALGTISVIFTQGISIWILGPWQFILKIIDVRKPIRAFTGILELMSEFSKIFSFAFRLFGNIFAGGVLLLVIGFLAPYIIPLPFMVLEIFIIETDISAERVVNEKLGFSPITF